MHCVFCVLYPATNRVFCILDFWWMAHHSASCWPTESWRNHPLIANTVNDQEKWTDLGSRLIWTIVHNDKIPRPNCYYFARPEIWDQFVGPSMHYIHNNVSLSTFFASSVSQLNDIIGGKSGNFPTTTSPFPTTLPEQSMSGSCQGSLTSFSQSASLTEVDQT